jgi:hypothetical protein
MAIIVSLPFCSRPVTLPVLAALAVKGGPAKPDLAGDLLDVIAERFGDRDIHLVGDSAYGCGAFAGLGDGMTMTTRAKVNATFFELAPPKTGKRAPTAERQPHRHTNPDRDVRELENRYGVALRHHQHREDH